MLQGLLFVSSGGSGKPVSGTSAIARGMKQIGRVGEIWRYPVKSMGGERVEQAPTLFRFGIPGDRGWAVRDERRGEIVGAKQYPQLLLLSARYLTPPAGADVPDAEVIFPDGTRLRSSDPHCSSLLSDFLGARVTLCRRRPAEDLDHYRRARPVRDLEGAMRLSLGLKAGDPLPDLSRIPRELLTFVSPPGTYFDCFELHLLTGASLSALARLLPDADLPLQRFRPNIFVDCGDEARAQFLEREWTGACVRAGEAEWRVVMPVVRCAMVGAAQEGVGQDPRVLKALVRECSADFGAGLSVVREGRIRVGDPVLLEPAAEAGDGGGPDDCARGAGRHI